MKKWLWGGIILGLAVAACIWFDPTRVLWGRLRGETFFQGRPISYWRQSLESDPATADAALAMLQQDGKDSIAVLTEFVQDPATRPPLRSTAADLLGEKGAAAAHVEPVLIKALEDPDPHLPAVAALALPKIGVPAERAVPALIRMLEGNHKVVAARVLSEYRAEALPALDALVAILEDPQEDTEARWNAARTIGKIGPGAEPAVDVLVKYLTDPDDNIREHSAEALGDIGPVAKASIPELVKVLKDPYTRARRDAVRSLGNMGAEASGVVSDIEPLLQDPEKMVQDAAANALKAIAEATGTAVEDDGLVSPPPAEDPLSAPAESESADGG